MKKMISFALAIAMCLALCVPSFASEPLDTETLPPWVKDGEQWFPANSITPREDFGLCPRGHTAPSGFKFEGQTIGEATGHYDNFAEALTVFSILGGDAITVKASSLGALFFAWLDKHENPNLYYIKFVYTKGSQTWYHISYVEKITDKTAYTYITCEKGYEL